MRRNSLAVGFGLPLVLLAAGCRHHAPTGKAIQVEPNVRLVRPETRALARTVGQPGFIYPYEETAIYPKVAGFVQQWKVDIGDPIRKGQEIALLSVPELDAQLEQKKAQVEFDTAQIDVAEQMVDVATQYEKVAAAQVQEARANVGKYQAAVERWESEVKRLTGLTGDGGVIDKQVLEEAKKQLKADTAAREASRATATASEANQLARKADIAKARADVKAARAKVLVSRADEKRVAFLVEYTHLVAPYDGVVVVRNVNTGDYVQPGSGDQTQANSQTRPAAQRSPLYIVARTDRVRVYVDVPEMDAPSVAKGTTAHVRIQAQGDEEIAATVSRTSWSLRPQSRSLRAEIDLPNPDKRLLPGMYAYGRLLIGRKDVRALPLAAIIEIGNQNCCYLCDNGKAVQTPVQVGIDDGTWVEVAKKRAGGEWTPFTGAEEVILGDLTEIKDGQRVQVDTGDAAKE